MWSKIALGCLCAGVPLMAFDYTLHTGWNLLGATEGIADPDSLGGETFWTYREGHWLEGSAAGSLEEGEGFWLYSNSDTTGSSTTTDDTATETEDLIGISRVLYAPLSDTTTYLIDADENVVQTWESSYRPGLAAYRMDDGSLIRAGDVENAHFSGVGGVGGIIQKIASDGATISWEHTVSSDTELQHHDLEILPDGHILFIVWEVKSQSEALAAGREADTLDSSGELWADAIYELDPDSGEIVWEWKVWDHLTTDAASNPSKIDINHVGSEQELRDWNHVNGVDYNADLDQILISSKNFNEVWVIDHSLDSEAAATSAGDLLYRFGNPEARGGSGKRLLYGQHDAEWIDNDTVMLFNNGMPMGNRNYSTVDVYDLPVSSGQYDSVTATPELVWSYEEDGLFSESVSGVAYLDNGNYLITEGEEGRMFVVNEAQEVLWEYTVDGTVFKAEAYSE